MNTYHYLEVNPGKGIAFALIYIILIVIILSFVFGGFLGLANAVNNFGSSKGLGFLIGIVCLAPIFFLMKFIYPKITISTNDTEIVVTRKNQPYKIIRFDEINGVVENQKRLNTLTIYDRNNEILFHLQPFNNHQIMQKITKEVIAKHEFKKAIIQKKLFNTSYNSTIYARV